MAADEKLRICAGMAAHPQTAEALSHHCQEQKNWRGHLRDIATDALSSRTFSETEVLQEILRPLAPDCCDVITVRGAGLFVRERDLLPMLFENNRQGLTKRFLELIRKEQEPERYDLGSMLRNVLPESSLLRQVEDVRFFKNYPELTELIQGSGYLAALDRMTALLLENTPLNREEAFLRLYLTLAAVENQVPAFLFGKFRLAELCRRENRLEECRSLLAELEEMGAEFPGMDALKDACSGEVET